MLLPLERGSEALHKGKVLGNLCFQLGNPSALDSVLIGKSISLLLQECNIIIHVN